MYEGDRNRSFTDCRRHTLEVSSADIADREYSGPAGFEEMGSPSERPMRCGQIIGRQIRSRLDEPVRVQRETTIEPPRTGNGACHDEDVPDVARLGGPSWIVSPADVLEMVTSFERHDFCLRP